MAELDTRHLGPAPPIAASTAGLMESWTAGELAREEYRPGGPALLSGSPGGINLLPRRARRRSASLAASPSGSPTGSARRWPGRRQVDARVHPLRRRVEDV